MRKIIINIAIMAGIVLLLVAGTLWSLTIYTNHNAELIKIPNLEGELSQAAVRKLATLGLEGVVIDTVYKDGAKRLSVINQNPSAGLDVKPGRKVYLVINTKKVPMVEVPDLAGKTSLDQAKNILTRRHLKLGKVSRVFMSTVQGQPVLEQRKSGSTDKIVPGSLIERNSEIDLVVGYNVTPTDTTGTSPNVPITD